MARHADNYATFVALDPIVKNAVASFGAYEDQEGTLHYIAQGRDRNTGEDIPYRFKFTRDKRFITVPKNKKDINGKSWLEFLRNHPKNANSPIAKANPWFKELDNERDANIALESMKLKNKAENLVFGLKPKEIVEIASILGYRGTPQVQLHKIVQYASKNPTSFVDMYEDPNRQAKSLFHACVDNKIITKHGFRFIYQDTHIGNDVDKAVIKIADDKDLREALSEALKKAGG